MQMRNLIPWGRRNETQAAVPAMTEQAHHPFLTLHREMNRLFDDVFQDFGGELFDRTPWPSVEVKEDDKAVRVTAELPGMEERDVDITFEDGALVLRGEKRSDVEDKDAHYSEHYYGRFERVLPIAANVDPDAVKANFKRGVLTVTLPKTQKEREGRRRIAINA